MQQPSQQREPPPYPGHSKQLYQPGTRKSFSGSETSTDVSLSSSENLSTSQRQEPQGQENTQDNVFSPNLDLHDPDTGYSILARLGMPQSFVAKPGQEYIQAPVTTCADPHQQWTHPVSLPHVTAPHELTRPALAMYQTGPNPAAYPHQLWKQNAEQIHMGMNAPGVTYYTHLPPPPEYPGMPVHRSLGNPSMDAKDISRSYEQQLIEKSDLQTSRSQPELARYIALQATRPEHTYYSSGDLKVATSQELSKLSGKLEDWDHSAIATRASQMVEMLSEDNQHLREELNQYEHKVSKLQKFELEIQRVHESYESLVKSSQKRERLEGALKKRMEEEIKKLKAENRQLREELEKIISCPLNERLTMSGSDVQRRVAEKEADLMQVLSHNKELSSSNESLDKELKSHQSMLQQQQSHIFMLDNALSEAQSNVGRLEEECQKKQMYMERVDQLQKALAALQSTGEKRELLQQQLQAKLEKELDIFRSMESGMTGILSAEHETDLAALRRICHQKDAKLLQLEGELIKWEQRFLEESAKKLSLEGETKDARLVALSHSSKETEKLIAEAKADKLKNMEELYQANRKVAELEARVKSLETQLSEKEAMIKVLQRSSMTRSSSVHSIYCSPLHSPRPSLVSHMAGALSRENSDGSSNSDHGFFREYGTIKHIKTSSASSVDIHRLADKEERSQVHRSSGSDSKVEQMLWHV